jgi:hypothetical protein
MILTHPRGHVAVAQPAHGWMCGQLARAWGNERFGAVAPAEEVCLAAEQHDVGMARWDLAPELDPATGLPATVMTMDLATHLALQMEGPELLATQSRYAALLASLKHCVMYERPNGVGLLRGRNRQIRSYLDRSAAFQAKLRATLSVPDAEIERNWRLVRTWDALSHNLLLDGAPCVRREVPAAGGALVDLQLDRRDDAHTLEPWPFASEPVVVRTEGRLLEGTFGDRDRLHEALARAPWVELAYELVPA